jgi:glycosyltransferase 2 family protein
MNKCKKLVNLLKNGGLFIIIVIVTFKMIFFNADFKEIIKTVSDVNLVYIAIGIAAMSLVVLCEAINIRRSLKSFKERATLLECVQYSFTGIFFSSITPSATGGQPMQLYYMHKKKIDISNGMLALLICLATYQLVTVSMAIMGVIIKFEFLKGTLGKFSILLFLGIGLNVILLVLILVSIFSKKLIFKAVNLCVKVLQHFNYQKSIIFNEKALIEIEKYKKGADYIKNDKIFIIKTILTTTVQILALHSIPFWIYKSIGMSSVSLIQFILIQSTLYITGAALPLPGAVGIGEKGFLIFFKTLFPIHLISSAMLLSRGISFYLMVLISGIGVMVLQINLNKNLKGVEL